MANVDTRELEQQVNEILPKVLNEDGHIDWALLPEGTQLDPAMQVAIIAEKRRRDTQATYTKVNQELKKTKALKQALEENLKHYISEHLTTQEAEELEDLKYEDPDAYIDRLNSLKKLAQDKAKEELSKIEEKAIDKIANNVTDNIEEALKEISSLYPDKPLTQDMLELEVPARLYKQIKDGDIDALHKAHQFIYGSKEVTSGSTPPTEEFNFSSAGSTSGVSNSIDNIEDDIL